VSQPSSAANCAIITIAWRFWIVNAGTRPAASKMIRIVNGPVREEDLTSENVVHPLGDLEWWAASGEQLFPRDSMQLLCIRIPNWIQVPVGRGLDQVAFGLDFARHRVDAGPADLNREAANAGGLTVVEDRNVCPPGHLFSQQGV
jgi:hypothetical protein